MKRAAAVGLVLFAACLQPAAASAQLAPGISGTSTAPIEGAPNDYWVLLRNMGHCVAQAKREDAASFLSTQPGSAQETTVFRKMFGGQRNMCMQDFVRASLVRAHLRGAIAESMYGRILNGAAVVASTGQRAAPLGLHKFAACFLDGNREDAVALLRQTRLGTDEETEAVRRMAPDFARCLPADRKVELRAYEVRMALSEALYHDVAASGGMTAE